MGGGGKERGERLGGKRGTVRGGERKGWGEGIHQFPNRGPLEVGRINGTGEGGKEVTLRMGQKKLTYLGRRAPNQNPLGGN